MSLLKINSGDSHSKIGCLEEVWPVGAVSFSYLMASDLIILCLDLYFQEQSYNCLNDQAIIAWFTSTRGVYQWHWDSQLTNLIYSGSKKVLLIHEKENREGYLYAATVSRCIHMQSPTQVLTWSWPEINFGFELLTFTHILTKYGVYL